MSVGRFLLGSSHGSPSPTSPLQDAAIVATQVQRVAPAQELSLVQPIVQSYLPSPLELSRSPLAFSLATSSVDFTSITAGPQLCRLARGMVALHCEWRPYRRNTGLTSSLQLERSRDIPFMTCSGQTDSIESLLLESPSVKKQHNMP